MTSKTSGKAGSKRVGRPAPPHNAKETISFRSIGELAAAIGAETRRASLNGAEVVMSQAEAMCRLLIDRAIKGSNPDLRLLIKMMATNEQIAGSVREQWTLVLAGADADL